MTSLLRVVFVFFLCFTPCFAQAAKLKQELKAKETAAKKDPEAIYAVAKWAAEKSLLDDAKRLYQAVLKVAPNHEGANEALGNQNVEGKWLPAKEAEALRKKVQAAEFAAKGMVDIGGVWVEKELVDDAKRGIFHHEKEAVTKEEKLQFQAGRVRHPDTGEFIDQRHLEKAKGGYYQIGSDRWVDVKEADQFHSELKRPWLVHANHGLIISTLSLAKIQELRVFFDQGVDTVAVLFDGKMPTPGNRPVVWIAATEAEYRELGTAFGDGADAAGMFLVVEERPFSVQYIGDTRPAIVMNEKDWGSRYVRHAAAMAYVHGLSVDSGVDLPMWFVHGVGSMTSRFQTDGDAGFLGRAHQQRGGVRNMKGFFSGFAISGDMESTAIAYSLYQAGLCLAFATKGGEAKVTEAYQEFAGLLTGKTKGNAEKAMTKLQNALIEHEAKMGAYLQQLVAKAPQ
ncbi:MAG: hypothetical protein JNK15_03970 [Planctomycetes bacterium]|nr:hypothetical protein [Planctomycetota bacterium]